jgi:hypothetical protein
MIISECFLVMRDREESLLVAEDADTVFKWCASILTWVFKDVVFFLVFIWRCHTDVCFAGIDYYRHGRWTTICW